MSIRPATSDDLAGVVAIYAHAVAHSTATFDIEAPGLEHWQAKLDSADPRDVFLVAATPEDGVLGFAYSSAYRPRPAYQHTRETTIYLAPGKEGRGTGRALYAELLDRLRAAGVHTALAVVAVPNPASEALHRAHGFVEAGRLREVGHKFGQWLDVVHLQLMLDPE